MDEYTEKVLEFAAYINHNEKVVGIYATNEECVIAESSFALKKLRNLYKYRIQMVIK